MIDKLRMIGIEKGKPFAPDAERTQLLNEAAGQGFTFIDGMYKEVVKAGSFAEGSRWSFPESIAMVFKASQEQFANPELYPVDARGLCSPLSFLHPNVWAKVSSTSWHSWIRKASC
jgi:hypothetical protein